MKKEVKLIKSQDDILIVENNEDSLDILASKDEIGLVCEVLVHETTNEFWTTDRIVEITQRHIDRILDNDGTCYIDMITYEGDYCGYRKPKLIDGKVIIHM
jgi:hypothetical protein